MVEYDDVLHMIRYGEPFGGEMDGLWVVALSIWLYWRTWVGMGLVLVTVFVTVSLTESVYLAVLIGICIGSFLAGEVMTEGPYR